MIGVVVLVVLLGFYAAGIGLLAWVSPRNENGDIIPARRVVEAPLHPRTPMPPARRPLPVDAAVFAASTGSHVPRDRGAR